MRSRTNHLTLLCLITLMSALVALSQSVPIDEDAPRLTAAQRLRIHQLNSEIKTRTDAVTRNDPRYARYLADFEGLKKEGPSFRQKYAAFKSRYADYQKEILRKAGIDRRAYNLRLKAILPHIQLDKAGEIVNPKPARVVRAERSAIDGFVFTAASFPRVPRDSSFNSTDFSRKWSFQDCSQASVTFDSSREFSIFAGTTVSEDDCDDVKGARGTVINVPAGVTRVRVEITLDRYSLSTTVATPLLFSYGNSYAAVGIRVNGWIVGSAKKTNYFRHKYLDTVWSVAGGDFADAEENGDVILQCSFRPLVPGDYRIQAYGRVWVTTDGLAYSSGFSTVEGLQNMKVTFVN